MSDGIPDGFELCAQCGCHHLPTPGVCIWRLSKDAAFVLDAGLAALSRHMIEWVLRELGVKEGYRYVSGFEQRHAYLRSGRVLVKQGWREIAGDGAQWVTKADLPPDVLLIETDRAFGLIKTLGVPCGGQPYAGGE